MARPPRIVTPEPPEPLIARDGEMRIGLRFTAPYGFCDDHGDRWHWLAGQAVRNPYVLALLRGRSAPVEELEG